MGATLTNDFNAKLSQITPIIQNFVKKPARLSSLQKSEKTFLFHDYTLTPEATRDILKILSIRNSIIDEVENIPEQWPALHQCLTTIKNDRIITAICNENEEKKIIRFLDTPCAEEVSISLEPGLTQLKNYVDVQSDNITLHSIGFNQRTLQLETCFRDLNTSIDVFANNSDLWSTGTSIMLGEYKVQIAPFLLRLVCANGLTATHMASQRYFENRQFKQIAFNKLLNKATQKDLEIYVRENCKRLQTNKTSLREFFNARNTLLKESTELANAYFNDMHILEAYKNENIKNKNNRWLSTANSNINSYEFFNNITHCITHQRLKDEIRLELNFIASEIFFKGPDFSYHAPDPFIIK